jgi:hypothetical protein
MSTQTETPTPQTTGPSPFRPRRRLIAAAAIAVAFIAGLIAVLLAVVSAGSVVKPAPVTSPTSDSPVRQNTIHFIDNAQLNAMRAQVAETGHLPDQGITVGVAIPATDPRFTPRPAYVWVPPAWFARNHPQLPVIELLHGTPGNPSDWNVGMGAANTAQAFAEQHDGIAPILVMPDINGSRNADSECVNSTKYGDVATYLAMTIPAFMRNEFNASTAPGSVVELICGRVIDPGRVFDLTLPLDQAAGGYRAMDERRAIKTLLQP